MSDTRVAFQYPTFNYDVTTKSPEEVVYEFVRAGVLQIDEKGEVYRVLQKVGGNYPKVVRVPPRIASNRIPSGRKQIQVYADGVRVVVLCARLVWYSHHGEIPQGHHIHHKNKNNADDRIDNLELVSGSQHISEHNMGREPWNKGTPYGQTEAYLRSNKARKENYLALCKHTYEEANNGRDKKELAKVFGVDIRTVYSRLQYYKENCDVL